MTSFDPASKAYDAIVIGAGHNGLAAAAKLGASGRKVLVLEAANEPGGATRGREFAPGFRSAGLAHLINRLDPDVARDLGISLVAKPGSAMPTAILDGDRQPVVLHGAYGETIDGVTPEEATAFNRMRDKLIFQAGILKRFLRRAPPQLGAIGMADLASFASAGFCLIRKGRSEGRDFLRMLLMNVADVADEYLTDDRLKALVAFDATLGIHLGPRSPTSLLGLYYRLTGEVAGRTGGQFIPEGGMAAVAPAFVKAAEKVGVTIRCGTRVGRILADRGRASGVVLTDGAEIAAPVIVAAVHPQTAFLQLVDPAESSTGFVRSLKNLRTSGNVAKLDLALDRAPNFLNLRSSDHSGRIVLARSMEHVERAFNPAKYGEFSTDPVMEIVLPSLADGSLAPSGACTLSALVQYAPHKLKMGWEAGKPLFLKIILDILERHAPGISKSIVAAELRTPADIEAEYNLPGGHWHHGELQADQLLINRPTGAASGYKTPIEGLYLASAGAHPGGGISGLPGWNAARHILSGARS
ncbi:phytoene dehydrogenase-like protein [Pararhizobium capsulatum DSM 1112]|uniref:Pyridine nucleotide-disulfide oxidoreductase domain-containing protein 2 n=1 Tax=Pararhizobium capsulatum DSM 1112 TaxID=1121113 RepID=A0ABU0BS24_9HYPH|nr:NAD(P)/FAD-dependent oxidoreductase [Pararhizobium capsulatum]MDQ0321044.1 phytoene dehydrogenase-like protein [Pararhizobium capsulatum DSM 1112]